MVTIYVLPETKENYPTSKAFHGKNCKFIFKNLLWMIWSCCYFQLFPSGCQVWNLTLPVSFIANWFMSKIAQRFCPLEILYLGMFVLLLSSSTQIFRPSNHYNFVFRFPFDRQGCWFSHFPRSATTSPKSRPMAAELWPLGELWRNPPCSPGQLGDNGPEIKNIPCEYHGVL